MKSIEFNEIMWRNRRSTGIDNVGAGAREREARPAANSSEVKDN